MSRTGGNLMPVGRTNRRAFIAGLGGAAAWPAVLWGQQPIKPKVGYVSAGEPGTYAAGCADGALGRFQ